MEHGGTLEQILYIHPNCNQGATSILSSSLIAQGPFQGGNHDCCMMLYQYSVERFALYDSSAWQHVTSGRIAWTTLSGLSLTARKSLKCHHLALTLQIFIDHLQHLPQNHDIYLHAGEDAGYLTGRRDNQHQREFGNLKNQVVEHPPLHFNTTTTVSTQNLNQRQFNRQVKICFSQRIVVAHQCEHQYDVYYTSVSVYMTVYASYERTAYWLFTVNEYARVNSSLFPHTRRASGSVRYCWKLWSEIVASGLCPKASCFYHLKVSAECTWQGTLVFNLLSYWVWIAGNGGNCVTSKQDKLGKRLKDKPLSGEISPEDKFLQQIQKRWQIITNHMDNELTMVEWISHKSNRDSTAIRKAWEIPTTSETQKQSSTRITETFQASIFARTVLAT